MEVRWQDICLNLKVKRRKKLIRDTVLVFYASFESNIVPGCNTYIRNIGTFKGSSSGVRHEEILKKLNRSKTKYYAKLTKRKQRLWVRETFDENWID